MDQVVGQGQAVACHKRLHFMLAVCIKGGIAAAPACTCSHTGLSTCSSSSSSCQAAAAAAKSLLHPAVPHPQAAA